ncbi:uncharacterized protein B0H18DRAFT_1119255 [Fomitopsis serialis]|uniref:uncharacterized protein n=1 Tax=Fomitopsis serialis TaxID=139415 RepID=UPI0020088A42|nr:uncharacterized protein B0H18DRAFT_1119255 [Neoantrodia serialis]KAH9925751.1 hypothetical protein B0H18DRAFT_1119255 [Neoantrodia serialis]
MSVEYFVNKKVPVTTPELMSAYACTRRELLETVDAMSDEADDGPQAMFRPAEARDERCIDPRLLQRAASRAPSEFRDHDLAPAPDLNTRTNPIVSNHASGMALPVGESSALTIPPPATPSRKPRSKAKTPQSSPAKRTSARLKAKQGGIEQTEKSVRVALGQSSHGDEREA